MSTGRGNRPHPEMSTFIPEVMYKSGPLFVCPQKSPLFDRCEWRKKPTHEHTHTHTDMQERNKFVAAKLNLIYEIHFCASGHQGIINVFGRDAGTGLM